MAKNKWLKTAAGAARWTFFAVGLGVFYVFWRAQRALAAKNYFDDVKSQLSPLQLGDNDPVEVSVQVIKLVLSVLALVVVALIIYGGLRWMLARGNDEEVAKAKEILKASIIGLFIILASYGITQYLFDVLTNATE